MSSPSKPLGTSFEILATGGANETAILTVFFTNSTLASSTLDVCVVASAGSPSDSNTIIKQLVIPAEDTYTLSDKIMLGVGQTLQAKSSVANAITVVTSKMDL